MKELLKDGVYFPLNKFTAQKEVRMTIEEYLGCI